MAEWVTNDELTAALMNQKGVYVGAGAPGNLYEGQVWVDTSTDPPTLKIYDDTNAAWLQYHATYYEEQSGAWANPSQTPVNNGDIVILYNSTQADTRIYGYSNSGWVNFDTSPTQTGQREGLINDMTDGKGDTTIAADTSIGGFNKYNSLTIDATKTLTLTDNPGGIATRTLVNNGTIHKSYTGGAGATSADLNDGGNGGGTLIIAAKTIDNNGTIRANGEGGDNGAWHAVNSGDCGGGNPGTSSTMIRVGADSPGNGGDGYDDGTACHEGSGGTPGGGATADIENGANDKGGDDGGTVTLITAESHAGLDAVVLGILYAEDTGWDYFGAGGGLGGNVNTVGYCGGGGGSGGLLIVSCLTYDGTGGTLSADGGAGGNGGAGGARDWGGSGGGGGITYLYYDTLTAAGTIQAAAGAAGTGDASGLVGAAGDTDSTDVGG